MGVLMRYADDVIRHGIKKYVANSSENKSKGSTVKPQVKPITVKNKTAVDTRAMALELAAIFKTASDANLDLLNRVAKKSVFNRIEGLLTPKLDAGASIAEDVEEVARKEREYLRKRYNVCPKLTGSMPLKLGVPGDVDLDFYARVKSPNKFKTVVRRLESNPDYISSPYNKTGTSFYVFNKPAKNDAEFPVDFAIAYGADADRLAANIKKKEQVAAQIPEDLRQKIIEKKMILKHTPVFGKQRYKAWKRDLDTAMTGELIRIKRTPMTS